MVSPAASSRGRTAWSREEDDLIREHVRQRGLHWRNAEQQFPGRSDDAIRNRFKRLTEEATPRACTDAPRSQSDDAEKRVSWTSKEDALIVQTIQKNKKTSWTALHTLLPSRTPHAIRNRFNRLMRSLGLNGNAACPGTTDCKADATAIAPPTAAAPDATIESSDGMGSGHAVHVDRLLALPMLTEIAMTQFAMGTQCALTARNVSTLQNIVTAL